MKKLNWQKGIYRKEAITPWFYCTVEKLDEDEDINPGTYLASIDLIDFSELGRAGATKPWEKSGFTTEKEAIAAVQAVVNDFSNRIQEASAPLKEVWKQWNKEAPRAKK